MSGEMGNLSEIDKARFAGPMGSLDAVNQARLIGEIGNLSQSDAPVNPFLPNPALEQQVAPVTYPVNPLILALAQKFGFTNLLRNRQNEKQSVLQDIGL